MILILGSQGMLGGELMGVFGNQAIGWDRRDVDASNFEALNSKIQDLSPDAIINCVAYNDVDGAERNRDLAFMLNAEVPKNLATIANSCNSLLVHFSSNYVFDGEKGEYEETDKPHALSVYGQSKLDGEMNLIGRCKKYYIIRTSVLFGTKGQSELSKKSFPEIMLALARETDTIKVISDELNGLTYAKDLAAAVKQLLEQNLPYGVYHITNSGFASWYDFAKEIFKIKGLTVNLVPILAADFKRLATRPKQAILSSTKIPKLRPWQEALKEFLKAS